MLERWKKIKGTNERYQISNKGRVWSNISGKYLVAHPNGRGYLHVLIYWEGGGRSTMKVHRMVAEHFLLKPRDKSKDQINHKDGCKINNDVSNLEWCDGSHNVRHSYDMGLEVAPKGVQHWGAKLTEAQAQEALTGTVKHEISPSYYAEKFGIGRKAISKIKNRQRWKHLNP